MTEPGKEITRADLQRELVVNAMTKPATVLVTAGVAVAALLTGAAWLWAVALVVFVALTASTFFDSNEAERVGDRTYGRERKRITRPRIDPSRYAHPIANQLAAALAAETRIRKAIGSSTLPLSELETEVTQLVGDLDRTAGRAELVYDYLAVQDRAAVEQRLAQLVDDPSSADTVAALRDQLQTQGEMETLLRRFYGEMEQTVASLDTVHAQVVRMQVTSDAASDQQAVAARVRDLRERTTALAQGLGEALGGEEPGGTGTA